MSLKNCYFFEIKRTSKSANKIRDETFKLNSQKKAE